MFKNSKKLFPKNFLSFEGSKFFRITFLLTQLVGHYLSEPFNAITAMFFVAIAVFWTIKIKGNLGNGSGMELIKNSISKPLPCNFDS